MAKKNQDIIWLSGQVFLFRDFVKVTDEKGLEKLLAECPYGDLTDEERATFQAAFQNPRLRAVVEQWWEVYDKARAEGEIPEATPWGP